MATIRHREFVLEHPPTIHRGDGPRSTSFSVPMGERVVSVDSSTGPKDGQYTLQLVTVETPASMMADRLADMASDIGHNLSWMAGRLSTDVSNARRMGPRMVAKDVLKRYVTLRLAKAVRHTGGWLMANVAEHVAEHVWSALSDPLDQRIAYHIRQEKLRDEEKASA